MGNLTFPQLVILAFVTGLPATIASVGAIWVGISNKASIKDVHLLINSRLSQLLDTSKALSFAEGKEAQRSGKPDPKITT